MVAFRMIAAAALAAAAPLAAQAEAADAECAVSYVIQPGDTMRDIALLAYGTGSYQLIYSRNRDVIADLAAPPAGREIVIPCVPGAPALTPDAAALAAAMAPPPVEPAAPAVAAVEAAAPAPGDVAAGDAAEEALRVADEESVAALAAQPGALVAMTAGAPPPALKLLTADGQAPFADRGLRAGGMATELAVAALERMGMGDGARIVFVNDRDSHLKDLLLEGSFDIGFPWRRPACEEIALLEKIAPDEAWLCREFHFSEPFYEIVYGFFVRKGDEAASGARFADFAGGRICRPAGAEVTDLAVVGLGPEAVELARPATLSECFALLLEGAVDAVSGEVFAAETEIAQAGLADRVEELTALSLLQSVHAVAPRTKPAADAALAGLSAGIVELKVSGDWFRIVGRHLAQN